MKENYLLIKRGYYWRPNSQGYTAFKNEAGRYSLEDAQASLDGGSRMIHEDEAEMFSPAADVGQMLEFYKAAYKQAITNKEMVENCSKEINRLSEICRLAHIQSLMNGRFAFEQGHDIYGKSFEELADQLEKYAMPDAS